MKILIVSDNVAPYRIEWAEELAKVYSVTMAYYKDHDQERNDSWLVRKSCNVNLVKLPAIIIKNHAISFEFIKLYKKMKPDITIFDGYGIIPNIIGMIYMNKKTFFVNVDGVDFNAKDGCIKRWIKRKIFSENAYFLCGSEIAMSHLEKYGACRKQMVAHHFSSIYDADILKEVPTIEQRSRMKAELRLKECVTILAVGRFLNLKQFDKLIYAFRNYDAISQLVLIGEGPEKKIYEELIRVNHLQNVKIIDFMPLEELKKYYYASDFLVLPSYSEVWGLVVNEGMGFGALPVIVSNRCGVGYGMVVGQDTGFQFEYNNIESLERYMGRMIRNTEERYRMSENCLKICKEFTIEYMAKVHMQLFEEVMANK